MANKLEVRDLRISFRTVSGKVQAVRGISFDLKEGETLAIVGESGSGKSVTSKAILGIQAGNAINEGGEILYDGMDLLKISEDDFYRIRGDKIAMIFQDPLSSLNPIMKIGNQLTEAMLLKGKARQKNSKAEFERVSSLLNKLMREAAADAGEQAEADRLCSDFKRFETKHTELEKAYNEAREAVTELLPELDNALFLIEKKAFKDPKADLKEILTFAGKCFHEYVVAGDDAAAMKNAMAQVRDGMGKEGKAAEYQNLTAPLSRMREIAAAADQKTAPDFFSMGYYLTFAKEALPELPVEEQNAFLQQYLEEHFLERFSELGAKGLKKSAEEHFTAKEEVLKGLAIAKPVLANEKSGTADFTALADSLGALVKKSIDPIEIVKDSTAYTFESSFRAQVASFERGVKNNPAEEKRFAKQQAKYQAFIDKNGYEPEWKPTPLATVDFALVRENMTKIADRLEADYRSVLDNRDSRDYRAEMAELMEYLKKNASGIVNKVTRSMAKVRAIKLMEEVGIPEPRLRYKQYPFEFSGGMRQRIVIAIALAANPDIMVCVEPTTALDVAIQAQILELINKLKRERNLSIIFITHDLGVVANMADKIAVMYAGRIVEMGTSEDIFYHPVHPYTWALLSSMPDLDTNDKLEAIPGTPPDMIYPPKGDAFAERNKYALAIDFEQQPPMFEVSDTHKAATWLLHPDAPKIDPPKIVTDRIARMKEGRNNDGKQ